MNRRTLLWLLAGAGVLALAAGLSGSSRAAIPSGAALPTGNGKLAGQVPRNGAILAPALAAPKTILYDQYDNPGGSANPSQQFPDFPAANAQVADDFPLPLGQVWRVNEVDVAGSYTAGGGPAQSFNVYFYTSVVSGSYAVPGLAVYTATAQTYSMPITGSFQIPLASPAILIGGINYFVSVQAVQNLNPTGQWFWGDRSDVAQSPAAWRNPGGAFGVPACRNWDRRDFCIDDADSPDQQFRLIGTLAGAATATPPNTGTPTATVPPPPATPTRTGTPLGSTPTRTGTPLAATATHTAVAATATAPAGAATSTGTPVPPSPTPAPPTGTPCAITFSDVAPPDYFYTPVQYLYCNGVISGYADNTFRPYAHTTRAQMVKVVILGFQKPVGTPVNGNYTFADLPPANPFYGYIETAAAQSIVSGYTCGSPGEPCDAQNRPYFRPYAGVTRGQLSKIDVVAAGWTVLNPASGTFADVLPNTAFYPFVETAVAHAIISGYSCGSPGEPCDAQTRPYFRQYADATRGQIAKIVYLSLCCAPRR